MGTRKAVLGSLLAAAASTTGIVNTATSVAATGCKGPKGSECLTVHVPLDRSHNVPGAVRLRVLRYAARSSAPAGKRIALIPIVGGPGLAATEFGAYYKLLVGSALRTRDLVLFDQRGTGMSGVLRCPTLENNTDLGSASAAGECARSLGPRRAFYRTLDTVEDIDAVRRAVGASKVLLVGFSYGTRVALRYAQMHPDRTEAIILDGAVPPDGIDAMHTAGYQAVPGLLRDLCVARCDGITKDPVADLAAVMDRVRTTGLSAQVFGGDGVAHTMTLNPGSLFGLITSADQTPLVRAALPAALHLAAAGDAGPLLRLMADSAERHATHVDTTIYSPAAYAATQCAEATMPYDRATPGLDGRSAQVGYSVGRMPAAAFWPFDPAQAVTGPLVRLCIQWPDDPRPDFPKLRRIAVRALLLSGEADLSTPLEGSRKVAKVVTQPVLVDVPDGGHGVLESSACARNAVTQFLAGRARSQRCPRYLNTIKPWPLPPAATVQAGPADLLMVARQTLSEIRRRIDLSLATRHGVGGDEVISGGLRGGRFLAQGRVVTLDNVELFTGVPVSGSLRPGGTLTVGTLGTATVDLAGRVVSATTTDGQVQSAPPTGADATVASARKRASGARATKARAHAAMTIIP
jgi:pimeloyl-ACP methyl ester carboxylesterase